MQSKFKKYNVEFVDYILPRLIEKGVVTLPSEMTREEVKEYLFNLQNKERIKQGLPPIEKETTWQWISGSR